MKNRIGVVGSINTDLVIKTDILPKIGETVTGNNFMISFGGKGANEAVAAARLNASVNLLSCVGDDMFSKNVIAHLQNEGVHITAVKQLQNCTGGVASIIVSNKDNQIIVVPGANEFVNKEYVEKYSSRLLECSIVGAQFEIPIEALEFVSRLCKDNNIKFVLNPSPIKGFSCELFENATYVIVNEIEIKDIAGYDENAPYSVISKYPNKLILTKGGDGCFVDCGNGVLNIPAINVDVVDTTGAGDTFMGAFMVAINNDMELSHAIQFANICAGLKTTKLGAQTGMPYLDDVKKYIKDNNIDLNITF